MSKKLLFTQVDRTIDSSTGEILSERSTKTHSIKQKEDHFIMLYLEDIEELFNVLSHPSDVKLLIRLFKLAEYNTGNISISSARREQICEQIGINKTNFSKNIKRLIEAEFISGSKGDYTLNPKAIWKGDKATRKALLDVKKQATAKPKMMPISTSY